MQVSSSSSSSSSSSAATTTSEAVDWEDFFCSAKRTCKYMSRLPSPSDLERSQLLLRLPVVLLSHVCSFLTMLDHLNMVRVSSYVHSVAIMPSSSPHRVSLPSLLHLESSNHILARWAARYRPRWLNISWKSHSPTLHPKLLPLLTFLGGASFPLTSLSSSSYVRRLSLWACSSNPFVEYKSPLEPLTGRFPHLTRFDLLGFRDDFPLTSWSPLSTFTSLIELHVTANVTLRQTTFRCSDFLRYCLPLQSLRLLDLREVPTAGMNAAIMLRAFSTLEKLRLMECYIADIEMLCTPISTRRGLSLADRLRSLDISFAGASENRTHVIQLPMLSAFSSLTALQLHTFASGILDTLPSLPSLQSLDLRRCRGKHDTIQTATILHSILILYPMLRTLKLFTIDWSSATTRETLGLISSITTLDITTSNDGKWSALHLGAWLCCPLKLPQLSVLSLPAFIVSGTLAPSVSPCNIGLPTLLRKLASMRPEVRLRPYKDVQISSIRTLAKQF